MTNHPKEADAYAGLAKTLRDGGRPEEAEAVIRDLFEGPAMKTKAHMAAANYYYGFDRERARDHFQRATEAGHQPTAQEMHKYLGGG
jgi:hypothetical protein